MILLHAQWQFMPLGSGWAIRSQHTGGYLILDLDHSEVRRVPVIACGEFPMAWKVEVIEEDAAADYIVRCAKTLARMLPNLIQRCTRT